MPAARPRPVRRAPARPRPSPRSARRPPPRGPRGRRTARPAGRSAPAPAGARPDPNTSSTERCARAPRRESTARGSDLRLPGADGVLRPDDAQERRRDVWHAHEDPGLAPAEGTGEGKPLDADAVVARPAAELLPLGLGHHLRFPGA